jgi:hypothetical protein
MTDLQAEIKKSLDHLHLLRDEVRLQLHLAGLEAKDRWNKLEPKIEAVEQAAAEATEASRDAVKEAITSLKEFRSSLHK